MILFPQRLLDGYRTFTTERLPTEQSRYRDLSVREQDHDLCLTICA